jgi:hypothetical protein
MTCDWPCDVRCNFSDWNLGCGRRVSSGLDWVFSTVDRAIILEDDCLASRGFFSFCDALLERYCDNESVWVISGNSYQPVARARTFFRSIPTYGGGRRGGEPGATTDMTCRSSTSGAGLLAGRSTSPRDPNSDTFAASSPSPWLALSIRGLSMDWLRYVWRRFVGDTEREPRQEHRFR